MDKKVILITGASSGIGKETALSLAKQGHVVILHGRNVEKTQAAFNEIAKVSGNPNLDLFTADLSLMSEVKLFAERIRAKYDRLDVLINNAGGQFGSKREVTAEGHEKTMAINLLAPFLLTYLLIDIMKNSKSARVVTVSSASYSMGGEAILDDIELEHNYTMPRSYALSKRYVIWIMRRFAQEMKKEGLNNITFNSVEPGSANTELGRISTQDLLSKIVYFLWKPMMWSLEKAAASSIYLAISPEVEGVTGKFYGNRKEKKIHNKFIPAEGEQIVWDYCIRVCSKYF
ncbi:SDR family NAD(P)-dependent oxidoreductase [Paenibacillus urinalis]|uniref:SDR family NAD(P)-dependent oxidoreductase n=1 Tax=Paenibacillus urinalis TaxID=521520 RepID=UPI001961CC19